MFKRNVIISFQTCLINYDFYSLQCQCRCLSFLTHLLLLWINFLVPTCIEVHYATETEKTLLWNDIDWVLTVQTTESPNISCRYLNDQPLAFTMMSWVALKVRKWSDQDLNALSIQSSLSQRLWSYITWPVDSFLFSVPCPN